MKKRRIFDIEKIGFGDEVEKVKETPKPVVPVVKEEIKVALSQAPIKKVEERQIPKRPPVILSEDAVVKKEEKILPVKKVKATPKQNQTYKPVEFVSPISGRKIQQPTTVLLAHGQYRLDTASMVEEPIAEDIIPQNQEEPLIKTELPKWLQEEKEEEICPSHSTSDDVEPVESEQTEVDASVSGEAESLDSDACEELTSSEAVVDSDEEVEQVHPEGEDTLSIPATEEAAEISESIEPAYSEEDTLLILQTEENAEILEEVDAESQIVEVENQLEEADNHLSSEEKETQEQEQPDVYEIDDVMSLLEQEEEQISLVDQLLESSHNEVVLGQEIEVDDVLNLLETEEQQLSIFDDIMNQYDDSSLDEVNQEADISDQDEEIADYPDDDFCNEVLEQVADSLEGEEEIFYYETPSLNLLSDASEQQQIDEEWILSKMAILEETFRNFGVKVRLTGEYTQGPTVTLIEIQPESGTKLTKITGLAEDLKLSLSVEELRIEPIAGKNTVGVEIPNPVRKMVNLKEILSKPDFILHESPLLIGLGQDVAGNPVYADIQSMPHGLIAGQTGSGKSVCINTLLVSLLYKASPEDVRMMLIDPKRVELAPYNAIPHLITPVICDERKAAQGLKWAVEEMERRYELFATNGVRDIKSFNNRRHEFEVAYSKLPYILIVIDELADLMMVSAQEVEDCIMRITQKARAAGIHLIVATQRPTVDVITGTIKSNIPSRMAFAVAQANDSRVILDETGAQNLLGQGDMLWSSSGMKVKRIQGAYISSEEIDAVVASVKQQGKPRYMITDEIFQRGNMSSQSDADPLLYEAMNCIFNKGYATASLLQTRLQIGYNRAARLIDTLEMNHWIGTPQGAQKQREILISKSEFEELMKDPTRF